MKRKKTMKDNDELELVMGVCWYTPEEFLKMKQIASDKSRFEDTYEEWVKGAEKVLNDLKKPEVNPRKVYVNTGDFRWWCEKNGLAPDGAARTKYVAEILASQRDDKQDSQP
jgi:hypothetical protein